MESLYVFECDGCDDVQTSDKDDLQDTPCEMCRYGRYALNEEASRIPGEDQ